MGLCGSKVRVFTTNETYPGQGEDAVRSFEMLRLSPTDVDRIFTVFCELDTDESGQISLDEFYDFFGLIRSPFSDVVFQLLDEDASGEIDFREFVIQLWSYCTHDLESLARFAFEIFDKDGSESLEPNEVKAIVASVYGESFDTDERVQRVCAKLDANEDGEISMQEFINFSRKYPLLLFPAYRMQMVLRKRVLGDSFWEEMTELRKQELRDKNVFDMLKEMDKATKRGQLIVDDIA